MATLTILLAFGSLGALGSPLLDPPAHQHQTVVGDESTRLTAHQPLWAIVDARGV
ncbi:hypothetical protein [Kitasatospora sp. NPDC088548]|uniref:hypothetical protein n=1 Tax=Kitasatospora sp. NPDC088548 TaxID=3364075 RepID=UPI0037F365C0